MAITKTTVNGPIVDATGAAYQRAHLRFTPSATGGDDVADAVIAMGPVEVQPDDTTGAFSIELAPSETITYVVDLFAAITPQGGASVSVNYRVGLIQVPEVGPVALQDLLPIYDPSLPTNEELLAALSAAVAAAEAAAAEAVEATSLQAETRADLIALVSGNTYDDGRIAYDGSVGYVYSSGATTISDMPGWLPYGQVSVRHFGATGDGSTYDDAAFQAAVDAYSNVYIPPPSVRYKMGATVTLNSGNVIWGSGYDGTEVHFDDDTNGFLSPDGNEACEIRDIKIKGSYGASTIGIRILGNPRKTIIKGCLITQFGTAGNGAAISMEDSGFGGTLSEDMWGAKISECNLEYCGRGIVLLNVREVMISHSIPRLCKGTPLYFEDADSVTIVGGGSENSATAQGATTSWALHLVNCRNIKATSLDTENMVDGLLLLDNSHACEIMLRGGTAEAGASMIKLTNGSSGNRISGATGSLWDAGHTGIDIASGCDNNEFAPLTLALDNTIHASATKISNAGDKNRFHVIYGDGSGERVSGANTVGTVSHDGTESTGASFQEDPSSEWVRFADGTQICYATLTSFIDATTAAGSIFETTTEEDWTYPKAFIDANVAVSFSPRGDNSAWGKGRPNNSISAKMRLFSAVSESTALTIDATAIGRWRA